MQETHQKAERDLAEARLTIEILQQELSQKRKEHLMTVDSLKMRYNDKLKEKEFEYVPRSDYQKIKQENQ